MIVFEFKAKGTKQQYQKIDEAIRINQFIRNKCLRFWKDNQNVKPYDRNKYTAVLANEFDNDLVAFEKLQVKNMVKNSKLAKSISDAGWSLFTQWLEYFGKVYGRVVVPVALQYTSQNCSNCGEIVRKSLSVRTHVCQCGCILDRDHNAAINILAKALKQTGYDLSTVGRTETSNACGEMTLCSDLVTSLSKVAR
jgi:IS605 OrfB family transposase